MNWFTKLFTVSKNSVNEKMEKVTENLVDIKREGNALVAQLDKDVKVLHTRIVEAQTEVQKSKYEVTNNLNSIKTFKIVARKALEQGREDDATNALSRVDGLEMINKTHQQTIDILQPIIDQQIEHVKRMQSEQNLLKAEITRLDLEEKAYKLKEKLMGGDKVSGGIDMQYLRDRVNKARATCEAKEIVNTQIFNEEAVKEASTSQSVQDRLQAMKDEMKGA